MTEYSEEISAYVTSEIKERFKIEAEDYDSQSDLLRQILRDRYAQKQAEETAEELRIESRLEGVAARLMDDMSEHRVAIDDDISLAAIYSVAQFEALKIAGVVGDTAARDAVRAAKKRVHADSPDMNVSAGSDADIESGEAEPVHPSIDGETETGFDLSWRDGGDGE